MKQSMADIKILPDGLMFCQNQFLNIHTDIPSKERKELGDKEPVFESKQSKYNSAELTNRERREKYKVTSYSLDELCFKYSTKPFLQLKYSEILSVAYYLVKVLDLLLEINQSFFRIEKEKEEHKNRHRKQKALRAEQQFYNALPSVQKYLSLLSDIKVSISSLISCSENINIVREYDELLYSFRINLELTPVPKDVLHIIDLILPGIKVQRIDEDNLNDTKNLKDVQNFLNFEKQLHILIKLFRDKLINQFSYYVTSDEFLNNPICKTIFVVDLATYRKLNFQAGGLYQDEIFDMEKSACGSDVYVKLGDFYTDLSEYFTKVIFDTKDQIETLETFEDCSAIQTYIGVFEMATRNKTGLSIQKFKQFMENPRWHEAVNNLLIRNRLYMYKALEDLNLDAVTEKSIEQKLPWNQINPANSQADIDTLHYLWEMQRRILPEENFPFAACRRVFGLFKYCKSPETRGTRHITKFKKMPESEFPESYVRDYLPLIYL